MFDKFGIESAVPEECATYTYTLHFEMTVVIRIFYDQFVHTFNVVSSLTIELFINDIVKHCLHAFPGLDNNEIYKWHLVKHQTCPLMIIDTSSSF